MSPITREPRYAARFACGGFLVLGCSAQVAWGQDADPNSTATPAVETGTDPLLDAVAQAADDRGSALGTRAALDVSTRHLVATSDGDWDGLTAIGLDVRQVLSTNHTDWGLSLIHI